MPRKHTEEVLTVRNVRLVYRHEVQNANARQGYLNSGGKSESMKDGSVHVVRPRVSEPEPKRDKA